MSELVAENPVLCQKVVDGILLFAIDPTGQDQQEQVPWLRVGLHVPPDIVQRSGALGMLSP